jgi:hypothetical protein
MRQGDWTPRKETLRLFVEGTGDPDVGRHLLHTALVAGAVRSIMVRINTAEGLYYVEQDVPADNWDQLLLAETLEPLHSDDARWYFDSAGDVTAALAPPRGEPTEERGDSPTTQRGPKATWMPIAAQWLVLLAAVRAENGYGIDDRDTHLAEGAKAYFMSLSLQPPDPDNLRKFIGAALRPLRKQLG